MIRANRFARIALRIARATKYWPLPVGHTHTTFRDGSRQKAAQKPTHTQTSRQDIK